MILFTGGAFQGKTEAAFEMFGADHEIIDNLQDWVLENVKAGTDVYEETKKLCAAHPDAVFIVNEMGCGVVPIDPLDREWREMTGRASCMIAKEAQAVYRVNCGIVTRIK